MIADIINVCNFKACTWNAQYFHPRNLSGCAIAVTSWCRVE
jgi:hypothetical protein